MRVWKGTLVRGVGMHKATVRPYARTGENHDRIGDACSETVDGLSWAALKPLRGNKTALVGELPYVE